VLGVCGSAGTARAHLIDVAITVDSRIGPNAGLPAGVVSNQVYTAKIVSQLSDPPTYAVPNTAPPGQPGQFSVSAWVGDIFTVRCTAKLTVPVFLWPLGFTTITYDVSGQKSWAIQLDPLGNGGIPLRYTIDLHD